MAPATTLFILCLCSLVPSPRSSRRWLDERPSNQTAVSQAPSTQPVAVGPGRVVVTISIEGLRLPAVHVSLKSVDRDIVLGQTISDAVGQVSFPDVPAGRLSR